ncbi:dihydrofolate reductase family protein [Streptomyces beigongshangae]|uniref:dihydrofolate reductase family protein n=1 Tax=Streptomyces beigongshangae TaxID=2841597 RepID=UPI0027E19E64|nr:dihydrofolate reductase family protein [Streptomyces sp. REN17]
MPKVRVHNVTISLDGFMAGTNQRPDAPFGDGVGWGDDLHGRYVSAAADAAAGRTGTDVDHFVRGERNIGATIMGRNMSGPQRGPWEDESWKGWWGDNPPYHHDVLVHTRHPRPALRMAGGTTFHFTGEPPTAVLRRAFDAADGRDVRIGGGAAVIRQYLRAGLIDELHLVIAPVLIGRGERPLDRLGDAIDGYRVSGLTGSSTVTHAVPVRRRREVGQPAGDRAEDRGEGDGGAAARRTGAQEPDTGTPPHRDGPATASWTARHSAPGNGAGYRPRPVGPVRRVRAAGPGSEGKGSLPRPPSVPATLSVSRTVGDRPVDSPRRLRVHVLVVGSTGVLQQIVF